MASPFSRLATELLEEIGTHLDVHDISSFRLTCRDIEEKASYGAFTHYFKTKNIDLDWPSLHAFTALTQHGGLVAHLQHCSISGIARNEDLSSEESSAYLELLTKAFRHLKQYSPSKALVSLSLRVSTLPRAQWDESAGELDPRCQWRRVWTAVSQTYNLTTAALSHSNLTVLENLDIFSSMNGCSLGTSTLISSLATPVSATSLSTLRTLKLNLSAPVEAAVEHSLEAEASVQLQTRYCTQALQTVRRMLHRLPLLESLQLSWYQIKRISETFSWRASADPRPDMPLSLPDMQKCTLRGLFLHESTLLSFLSAVRAPHVCLHTVTLVPPTPYSTLPAETTATPDFFASVFTFLLQTCTSFHLEDLFEDGRRLRFPQTRQPSSMPWFLRQWGSTIFSCSAEVKQKLEKVEYGNYTMFPRYEAEYGLWKRGHRRAFGPPGVGYSVERDNEAGEGGGRRYEYPTADYMQDYFGDEGIVPVVGPTGELAV
jgi:hypothetical protein